MLEFGIVACCKIYQNMDYKLHSGNIGEYYTAFFEMYLKNVDTQLDLNNCTDAEFSTFLHEYIHFLQDLTTTYGLTFMYYHGEYIQSVVNDIRNKGEKEFAIPYLYDDNKDNIQLEETIKSVTMGDFREGSEEPILSNVKATLDVYEGFPFANERLNKINCVVLEADNDIMLSFGAHAIKESMAYIMERLITKDYQPSPDYPYSSAEKVAKSICPEFASNILNVLALCDCSLMFTNPADVFYNILCQIRDKHIVLNKPYDLYDQLKNAKVGVADNITNPFAHYEMIAEEARKKLRSYFFIPDNPQMHEAYYLWINRVIDFAIYLRTKEPSFIINMVYDGCCKTNATLARIIHWIGTPLIKNKRKDYFSIKPHDLTGYAVEIMKSTQQMFQLLHEGVVPCSLYPWCKNSDIELSKDDPDYKPINPTPEVCLKKPWERINCNELCPFALLWRNWGLTDYTPIVK